MVSALTEPAQAQPAQPAPQQQAAPKRVGHATVVITRTDEFLYVGVPATIEVNGQSFASLWKGQSHSGALRPGPTTIRAHAWRHTGKYRISFTAQPGKTYRLVVSPRGESIMPGVVFGLAGTLIDAAVNENAGAFKITGGR